jgi:hypothetical protein
MLSTIRQTMYHWWGVPSCWISANNLQGLSQKKCPPALQEVVPGFSHSCWLLKSVICRSSAKSYFCAGISINELHRTFIGAFVKRAREDSVSISRNHTSNQKKWEMKQKWIHVCLVNDVMETDSLESCSIYCFLLLLPHLQSFPFSSPVVMTFSLKIIHLMFLIL